MDCITFNKCIDDFMNERLTDEELNDFLNHRKRCSTCAEELEVNYIVHEGMIRLDDKKASLNLAAAYKDNIKNHKEYIISRKRMIVLSNVMRTLSFWALCGVTFVYLRILMTGR